MTPSLTLVRRLRASPAQVFAAWIRAETLATWFGPHHTRVEAAELDVRPGGRFRVVLREDETIWTESSHKFAAADLPALAATTGFTSAAQWVDEAWPFADALWTVEGTDA